MVRGWNLQNPRENEAFGDYWKEVTGGPWSNKGLWFGIYQHHPGGIWMEPPSQGGL